MEFTGWGRIAIEPPASQIRFPDPSIADDNGLVGVGADLQPGTLLRAYRSGIFPMPLRRRQMGWWSPDPRGIVPLDGLRVSRSLRRSCDRYDVAVNEAFLDVVVACADPKRPNGWITPDIGRAYGILHRLGWAHSVEVRSKETGALVGGLYGVLIEGLFAGESMFHTATDASKVALVALVDILRQTGVQLLDVQWCTDHLASLGATAIPRAEYLARLRDVVSAPV